jgi:sugar phosphate isomerase/epimerase
MGSVRLTYCGNVHPAEDLEQWLATLAEFATPVAAQARTRGRSFGLGLWWNAAVAARLAGDAAARGRVARELADRGLPLWTCNVFPFGGFHDAVVKTDVYSPDWEREERVQYTRDCAAVAAALAPRGAVVPLSTLPLGYRAPGDAPADLRRMARNLARIASAFAAIEAETGVTCVLALEPEPCCLLETCRDTAAFLERWLFDEGAWRTVPEDVLRRHLGICVDLCHLAVVGEDPVRALADLQQRHIAVPKIQVSSCLELRDGGALDELLRFDEPRYLHQTVALNGARALDLGEVRQRSSEFARAGRVRTHFHMPIYWDTAAALGSTRNEVERVLAGLREQAQAQPGSLPLLEVETYTWSVLDQSLVEAPGGRQRPLAELLGAELDFAASVLAR